jgi:hypothetical protein
MSKELVPRVSRCYALLPDTVKAIDELADILTSKQDRTKPVSKQEALEWAVRFALAAQKGGK